MMPAFQIKGLLADFRTSVTSLKQRSCKTSYKATRLNTIQKWTPFNQYASKETYNTVPTNKQTVAQVAQPKVSRVSVASHGMNEKFLFMRKENHLNSCFNVRKAKLKEMTKQNQKIYQRINSQKSLYSSTDLNKSYESTREIKNRLAQSKLSYRSNQSSKSSNKSIHKSQSKKPIKKDVHIEIKAANIDKVQSGDLSNFRGLFIRDMNKPTKVKIDEKEATTKINTYRTNPQRQSKVSIKRSIEPATSNPNNPAEGGLLHRIAEDMLENKEVVFKRKSTSTFKHRRLFNNQ